MSRSLNKVMLIGNLGKDAEQRFTQSGTAVANFTMATTRRVKKGDNWEDETDWHNVVFWNSEKIVEFLTKGKQVFVEGRLQTRSWEDQSGNKRYTTEVVAENLILLSGSDKPQQQSAPAASHQAAPADDDLDVPF